MLTLVIGIIVIAGLTALFAITGPIIGFLILFFSFLAFSLSDIPERRR